MKVSFQVLLCLFFLTPLAAAQDTEIVGISNISGIDVIVVEEALKHISYDFDLQTLSLTAENTAVELENWYEDWLVALSGLGELEETFDIDTISQTLSVEFSSKVMMKSQGQFRMSGPFEMIALYSQQNEEDTLTEDSFLAFIGNDIPLKLTLLPEFEAKIKSSAVVEGELELTWNNQSYLVSPNTVTPLSDDFCTYIIALNESQSSDIMGNKTTEWRFDIAIYKCNDFVIL